MQMMRRSAVYVLWLLIISSATTGGLSNSVASPSDTSPNDSDIFRSSLPLTLKHDRAEVALVAALNGTIYLVDISARKILWSFASGQPIYSSYKASLPHENDADEASEKSNDMFIDVGEDWELYMFDGHPKKLKLATSIEEYIRKTPLVSDCGEVTLGLKNTTIYAVDAESGDLVHTYRLGDSPSILGIKSPENNALVLKENAEKLLESAVGDITAVKHLLYIMRTDYILQHSSSQAGNILWNLKYSEIKAEFKCKVTEDSFSWPFHNAGSEFNAEHVAHAGSRFPCRGKLLVYRIRENRLSECPPMLDRMEHPHPWYSSLPLPAPIDRHALGAVETSLVPLQSSETWLALTQNDDKKNIEGTSAQNMSKMHILPYISLLSPVLSIAGLVLYHCLALKKLDKLNKRDENIKSQAGMPKKKKARRSINTKNSANNVKGQRSILYENKPGSQGGLIYVEQKERNPLMTFLDDVDGYSDGRRIGKLFVSSKEIAKGSNGTVVLEGIYDGRPVAVKRLVQTHHGVAFKEIQNLVASDQHPNIVRWYGVECDQDFVYLSLERCSCSLNDLIYMHSESFQSQINTKSQGSNQNGIRLSSMMERNKDVQLWKENGYPSPQLLKLMRDIVSGLAHLHELGIIHRDLKPQNVLIIKEKCLCAKISDMGISKRLSEDMSSLTQHATGFGSSGWQAPEQLQHGRQTRAVDLFSLGCVLFFCVTGGKHPYGDSFERDVNIVNDRKDLFLVETIPEAVDLFSNLLEASPSRRPKASNVLHHPLFWNSEMRLSFLRDVSDRVEMEDREKGSELLNSLESLGAVALKGKWDEKLETVFLDNIGRYRRYKYDSIRDLLRVIRNKLNHYRELPSEIQRLLGPVPEGFDSYFSTRFPRLLIEVYKVIFKYCKEEEFFQKYTK